MHGEPGGIRKETVVAYFTLLFSYFTGGTMKHIDTVSGGKENLPEFKKNAFNN
jgi:hypothetical protein